MAIGRALTNAGFDVPFVNVLQDGLLLDPFTGEVLEENGGPAAAPTPAPQPAAAQAAPPRQYSSVTSPPVQQATQAVISGQQTPAQRQQTSQKLGMTVQQPGATASMASSAATKHRCSSSRKIQNRQRRDSRFTACPFLFRGS
ncbi:hypothetical protein C814_00337 [Anaerotruncus sp. G3(2012)]|uniref:hypothetical protein n=1 Tax=Anaerotruncus sp. G3(2012) TaxID=1235835 RepID=UPI000338E803|nr:hypothetical protein [Anaerotruncus sp. G3(2012)]EOS64447.1 hypothetical protein C814_00337 [Anaerotruncus sp. G3(2012)]